MMAEMHWESYLFSGFAATVVLTLCIALFRGLGLTRMDFPMMLGTIVTSNRDKAKGFGFLMNFGMGWAFSLGYILTFQVIGISAWWFGMIIGLIHSLFLLTIGMWLLPSVHPRMATEEFGPDPTHQLEPPGFLALHYGRRTPVTTVIVHLIYGAMLGWLYH